MTDRYCALTVVLDKNIRADDAKSLMDAIMHFRGVLAVDGVVADASGVAAEYRARRDLRAALVEVVENLDRKP